MWEAHYHSERPAWAELEPRIFQPWAKRSSHWAIPRSLFLPYSPHYILLTVSHSGPAQISLHSVLWQWNKSKTCTFSVIQKQLAAMGSKLPERLSSRWKRVLVGFRTVNGTYPKFRELWVLCKMRQKYWMIPSWLHPVKPILIGLSTKQSDRPVPDHASPVGERHTPLQNVRDLWIDHIAGDTECMWYSRKYQSQQCPV